MSEITLEILQDNISTVEIEQFIETSTNGTIFHSPRFLSYHAEGKFSSQGGTIQHLLFRKKRKILAFMPGMVFEREEGREFRSPYGGSYGSFAHAELSFDEAAEIFKLFLQFIRQEKITKARLVPPPATYCRGGFPGYFQYLYLCNGFAVDKADLLSLCPVSRQQEYPFRQMGKNAIQKYRQAEKKGIIVETSKDYDSFHNILVENRAKFGAEPTHTVDDLKKIGELFPERVLLLLAYLEGRPIGGAYFMFCNATVANCFYLCHQEAYSEYRSTNLLIPVALKALAEKGFGWLDFGASSFAYQPHESLIKFKESFGARGDLRYYFVKEFD